MPAGTHYNNDKHFKVPLGGIGSQWVKHENLKLDPAPVAKMHADRVLWASQQASQEIGGGGVLVPDCSAPTW